MIMLPSEMSMFANDLQTLKKVMMLGLNTGIHKDAERLYT